jgi:DeoR/GlpR family transcriptional regulator of sugar metabolism
MKTDQRHRTIAELLRQRHEMSVEELAVACDASGATIRRDLEVLAANGVLRRIHGGARSLIGHGGNPGYGQRELEDQDTKKRIGQPWPASSATGSMCGWTAAARPPRWPGHWQGET